MKRIPTVLVVSGARPNFPKVAPVIRALRALPRAVRPRVVTVHTGQHYDYRMSQVFFEHLGMPRPDYFLGAGSGSHAAQTAAVMEGFEKVLFREKPDLVVVAGDVNSTLAGALDAVKLGIPVAHIEAGLRSRDRAMPEEVNRIVTDHLSDLLFTHCREAGENLINEGIARSKIFFTGNVMIDSLLAGLDAARRRPLLERLGLKRGGGVKPYALVTLHRPSNVDDETTFAGIVSALAEIAKELPVLYPAHPRARANIEQFNLRSAFTKFGHGSIARPGAELTASGKWEIGPNGLYLTAPLGYLDFIKAEMHAACVFTDSGGVQEETSFLGVPCFTIRVNTERPITITQGSNRLAGTTRAAILKAWRAFRKDRDLTAVPARRRLARSRPPKWDGRAANRIAGIIARALRQYGKP
ncbi:MAG: UDP-N-acetyl glucosamine 2-epimerase [Candidatus Edwardsbacteria bacterium]|nr:UDP-N-acetyl glucosamine 2-epimerase [Candidatus Edwardsbacteria bacterium]